MSGTAASLLVTSCGLLGLTTFILLHRRDAFGAVAGVLIGFSGLATALVGFAATAPTPAAAAHLQAYAVVVEVTGVLCAAVGSALAVVLWRRAQSDSLVGVPVAFESAAVAAEPPAPLEEAAPEPADPVGSPDSAPGEDVPDDEGG